MKRLYLLRHAKAVPAEPGMDDHDRTLMLSGMHDAGAMARYLRKSDYAPRADPGLQSARTRQTAELVLQRAGMRRPNIATRFIWPSRARSWRRCKARPLPRSPLMVVGHNPGLEDCATLLAREPVRRKERARRDVLEEKFPTGALAVLDFDVGALARQLDRPGERASWWIFVQAARTI